MKKYSKLLVKQEVISDICEPIYLGSGRFDESDCFVTTWYKTQEIQTGRNNWIYHIDAKHGDFPDEDTWNPADHTSHGVALVIAFQNPLPSSVDSVHINSYVAELNSTGDAARIELAKAYDRINNTQDIGLGDFTIEFYKDNTDVTDNVWNLIQFYEFRMSDIGYRD